MDLALTESQNMLRTTARAFMEREVPKDVLVGLQRSDTGLHPGWWETAAQIGWLGMLIPGEYGGSGASLTDTAVLFEELGRGPLPGPFFASAVLGALVVLEAGTDEQKRRLLPDVANGSIVLTSAIGDPRTSWGPKGVTLRPERSAAGYRLSGSKPFVSDVMAATHVITAVRTGDGDEDISLLLIDTTAPGIGRRRMPGFLSWQGELTFADVAVPAAALLGGVENQGWAALERALERAWPVLSAYQVGGCQAVFDMTVLYSQERRQFGQPIGRFQRVQDHLIRMVNLLDGARWTTYEALWKLESGRPARAGVHMAQALASEAYLEVCNGSHEVHAGIGSSLEYGLAKHTQMSRTLLPFLGDPLWHRRRMADALAW